MAWRKIAGARTFMGRALGLAGWIGLGMALLASPARAGAADVTAASVRQSANGVYDFDVTIRSNDTGWDRYADRIEVLGPDGKVLGTRVLDHPHEAEQPFTRDLYGVKIPSGLDKVRIRAHFKPIGYDGAILEVPLRGK